MLWIILFLLYTNFVSIKGTDEIKCNYHEDDGAEFFQQCKRFKKYSVGECFFKEIHFKFCNHSKAVRILSKVALKTEILNHLRDYEELYLSELHLSEIDEYSFANLDHLVALDLEDNNISELPNRLLENATNLKYLALSRNNISEIPEFFLKNNNKLYELILKFNNIKDLSNTFSEELLSLQSLDISHNKLRFLSEVVFQKLANLLYLEVSSNQITYIEPKTFLNTRKLKVLTLDFNYLDLNNSVYFPENLESLNLSNNRIKEIGQNFRKLNQLYDLNLSNNLISFVDFKEFNFLADYTTIDLRHNLISYFDLRKESSLLKGNKSINVLIGNNPLHCDCHSIPLKKYLKIHSLLNAKDLYCETPVNLKNQLFEEVEEMNLKCS